GSLSVGATPALDFRDATVVGSNLGEVRSNGQLTLGGGFVRAVGGSIRSLDHFLKVSGAGLSSSGPASLLDFTNTVLTVGLLPGGALLETSSLGVVSDTSGR